MFATMSRSFNDNYLRIGCILRPHGIKGAIKVLPTTDDPMRFKGLKEGYLEQNGRFTPIKISVERIESNAVYLYVAGYPSIEAVEKVRDAYICVDRENAVSLPGDTWFICDLEGMDVFSGDQYIGVLTEVLQTGGVDVYRITADDGRKLMLPALKKVIASVDPQHKKMVLKPEVLKEVVVYED